MKFSNVVSILIAAIVIGTLLAHGVDGKEKKNRLLRHVVMFTFDEDATKGQVDEIVKAFGELPKKIKEIHSYEWGTNNSPEGLNKTHTHCFLVTFQTEADRDAYLPHSAHKAFVAKLKPILKDVTVFDYWASN